MEALQHRRRLRRPEEECLGTGRSGHGRHQKVQRKVRPGHGLSEGAVLVEQNCQ